MRVPLSRGCTRNRQPLFAIDRVIEANRTDKTDRNLPRHFLKSPLLCAVAVVFPLGYPAFPLAENTKILDKRENARGILQ